MQEKWRYEFYFNNWLYDNLPPSDKWLVIQDIDFVLQNYKTKRFLIIELKTKGNLLTDCQKSFYNMLHKRLVNSNNDWYMFVWTYLIEFEWTTFEDWNVYLSWSNQEKTMVFQDSLHEFLSDKLWLYEF